jgi:uncharacterized protein YjbI with pentapeptide repeats
MANPKHLKILEQGVAEWNKWRKENLGLRPELSGAKLFGANLSGVNLIRADLTYAHLTNVDLSHAELFFANFNGALLGGADFTHAKWGRTTFGDNDLSRVKGLETGKHLGPSIIGINTIYKSLGNIPEIFLRECGVPEDFIIQIPALVGALAPIQFHSCFISYSSKDEQFAGRLHARMRQAGLRVWYAPEEMKGGRVLREQIFNAIQMHDKLLLVLSENSLRSDWVMTEIRRAKKTGREENRRKLFPIRLVDMKAIQEWECFDADGGKDLAAEVREYFIPDFSNWKEHDAFEAAFDRLLRDLKAEEKRD